VWKQYSSLGRKSAYVIPIAFVLRISFIIVELIFRVKIRVYELPLRFGHLLVEPDILLAKSARKNEKAIKFAVQQKNTSSRELQKEWSRHFRKFPNPLLRCLLLYEVFCAKKRFTFKLVESIADELKVLDNTGAIVFKDLKDSETLTKLNIQNRTVIFLLVRDINYDLDIGIHTKGQHALYRNSDIENYWPAVSNLLSKNYFIAKSRTGSKVNYSFSNQNFFDLNLIKDARHADILQFNIAKKADFLLSTDTGALNLGIIFRKPIYRLNIASFALGNQSNLFRLTLLKQFVERGTQNHLKLEELIVRGVLDCNNQADFDKRRIQVLENSSESILDFVQEVIQDRNGKWKPNKNSTIISNEFQKLCGKYGYKTHNALLLPNKWSDKNIDWLL